MVIGIGGASTSGKSKLAEKIKYHFKDKTVKIISQDDYVFPVNQIPVIKGHINWECPESIDFRKFKSAIIKYRMTYDIVIAEGLLAFYNDNINRLYDKKIFIEISKETFFKRKTMDDRWGMETEWYIEHIWRSFMKYSNITMDVHSFLILNEENINIKEVLNYLKSLSEPTL
ncbi:MAG: hypothetical protein K8R37_13520 [Bacteroidales bacterium]|nr:hypothetical protein [Bacteroidales bacterium]